LQNTWRKQHLGGASVWVGRDCGADHGLVADWRRIQTLPESLRASLTWDQGPEMRGWEQVSVAADIDIYFCDPHPPWQRATNENTNGLLRQYFPKGHRPGSAH
jgi:hypothetical protein